VTVPNDNVLLSGTLLTPLSPSPHPGIVLVHGVEVTHRTELLPEAVELVQKGLAVLIYDLRGHAASGGDPPSMVEMAGDALAALTFMQSLDGVSTTEGGLLLAQKHLETDVQR
jgi:alpha-beta hydrolase superfamily lysophospholipase